MTPLRLPSDQRPYEPVRAIVELPEPIWPAGYAERVPYKQTWAGGVHMLGGGRTEECRAGKEGRFRGSAYH